MVLAAAQRFFVKHAGLAQSNLNQFTPERVLVGGVSASFGGVCKPNLDSLVSMRYM